MTRQYVYVSRSLSTLDDLAQILSSARLHNDRRGVTGKLLFTGGHFAQLLEGSSDALSETVAAIQADTRHEAMRCIIDEEIADRRCSGWAMAFVEVPGADDLIRELLGDPACIPAESGHCLLRLMFDPLPSFAGT